MTYNKRAQATSGHITIHKNKVTVGCKDNVIM